VAIPPTAPPAELPAAAATPEVGILPVATDAFSPVTVVRNEEIVRNQQTTLGDLLFDKPGISGTTYAPGGANRPIIRGLDNYRVRIQENGIGVQDVSPLGEDHAVPINPLVQDRIEVIRGPATLRYGSQAIGGVVSAENNRIPTFIPQGGYAGQILSSYSSVDNGGAGAAKVHVGGNGVAVHADGFKTSSEDYGTPRGRQFNSAVRSEGGSVGASFINENGFVGLGYSHFNSTYHVPGGEAAASRVRLTPIQDKVFARGEYRFDNGPFEAMRFWAGASAYRHNEISLDENGIPSVGSIFRNREFEGRLELQHVPVATGIGTLTGAIGFQAIRSSLSTGGEAGGLLLPTDTRSYAGYLFEQLDLGGGLRLQGAGRIEHARVGGIGGLYPAGYLPAEDQEEPFSFASRRRYDPKSVAVGLLQDLPWGFVGSLNGSYVERAPSAPELYSRGPHEATATFEIGNPNLKLERARTVEVGIRRSQGAFRLDATGYYTRYTGFIYKRETGALCDDEFASCGSGEELNQIVYSQQNATFYGAEIAGQLDVLPVGPGFLGIEGQYDFVRAKFDDGTNVPRIPPHRAGGGVFFRGGGWFARVNLLHAFDHREIAPLETITKGWNNLRAELSYTQALDRKVYGLSEWTLGIRGDNLLNDDIRNSASFKKDEVLLAGRSARVFLSAKF
jgi:iron complex outermembrane receptor protein